MTTTAARKTISPTIEPMTTLTILAVVLVVLLGGTNVVLLVDIMLAMLLIVGTMTILVGIISALLLLGGIMLTMLLMVGTMTMLVSALLLLGGIIILLMLVASIASVVLKIDSRPRVVVPSIVSGNDFEIYIMHNVELTAFLAELSSQFWWTCTNITASMILTATTITWILNTWSSNYKIVYK